MNVRLFVVESEEYSYRGRRMKCHSCGTEVQIQQGFCPSCGTFIGMPGQVSPQTGKKSQLWLIFSAFVLVLILVSAVPVWFLWRSGFLRGGKARLPSSETVLFKRHQQHLPAKLSELHGQGEVYFVPIGKQAIALE